MKLGIDCIGAMIFIGDQDNPHHGTLQVDYTDRENDELGFFIRYGNDKKDINVYVTCELWEAMYKMAQRDFPVRTSEQRASENG